METMGEITSAAAVLAGALGSGLLMGIERERRKGSGPNRSFAGLRTFAVTSVAGAAAALTQIGGLVVAGALLVAGLALLAYQRDRSDDPGTTTEIALLLMYLTGVLCVWSPALAAGLAGNPGAWQRHMTAFGLPRCSRNAAAALALPGQLERIARPALTTAWIAAPLELWYARR